MLVLAAGFSTERFFANAFDERNVSEWPPHPTQVFSALVAAHYEDPPVDVAGERAVLEWLEGLGAPLISCAPAPEREAATPSESLNNVSRLDEKELNLEASREATVFFSWPKVTATQGQRRTLNALAARVGLLGRSSSLTSLRMVDATPPPTHHPHPDGELSLRVMRPGQLQALDDSYERYRYHETPPRVLPARREKPRPPARPPPEVVVRNVFTREWIVFRHTGGPALPVQEAARLGRALRAVLMHYSTEPVPEILSGHATDGRPAVRPHAAFVPLPWVGSRDADGSLLGIAVVLPRAVPEPQRLALFRAIALWEASSSPEGEENSPVRLHLGKDGVWFLTRLQTLANSTSLREETWCRPSRRWTSVTPVALDRNPGDLRATDPRKQAVALEATCETLRQSCEHVGLPRPIAVDILSSSPWVGTVRAGQHGPFPARGHGPTRVLTHASLVFDREVEGPVLLGAGRYTGLGLFRPEPET